MTEYLHKVDRGIKIGFSSDYARRKKQYASHGDTIIEIATYKFTKELDSALTKALYEMKKNVVIQGQTSTEVYDLTEIEAKTICSFVSTTKSVEGIYNLLYPVNSWTDQLVTLEYFKSKCGNTFVECKYQRKPQEDHVNSIFDYIINNYHKDTFYLPPILLAKNIYNQYELIDGNHRARAIARISNDHPCMKQKIYLHIKETLTNDSQMVEIFRNLNKSIVMPNIHLDDSYINNMIIHTIKEIKSIYSFDCISSEEKILTFSKFITESRIKELITLNNINDMIQRKIIKGIEQNDMVNFIRDLNTKAINIVINLVEVDIFRQLELDNEVFDKAIEDLNEFVKSTFEIKTNARYIQMLKKTVESIRESLNNTVQIRSGVRLTHTNVKKIREPFILGLFNKPLLSVYNEI